jgi:hypothetical protein
MNVTITTWPIEAIFGRHELIARSPDDKRALARHLAAIDPETLQWLTIVGAHFGPAEAVGYSVDRPHINTWNEGD